jgi:multidrug resistance efflux pump
VTAAILILIVFSVVFWLVFFKFKWLRLSPGWGLVSALFVIHVLLVFVIGLRFVTPYSTNATVVQHTIQLIPRLPDPTLVTAVLVEEGVPVRKGQPLFQFDRRPYEYKVDQLEAQLRAARANVEQAQAGAEAADAKAVSASDGVSQAQAAVDQAKATTANALAALDKARASSDLSRTEERIALNIQHANVGAISQLKVAEAKQKFQEAGATVRQSEAGVQQARASEQQVTAALSAAQAGLRQNEALARQAAFAGAIAKNDVQSVEAQLNTARYYLEKTTLVAPEDGRIINLQVRPGMVSGIWRIGGIAALIVEADRYLLAPLYQEHLKYVRPGQPVEVSLDLYPGQIFTGKVDSIWRGSRAGQYLPSDELPKFHQSDPRFGQDLNQYAVKILLDGRDQSKFPIGAQGTAAIYTSHGVWAVLRKISIRAHSWLNWVYPIPF